jgi:hypothetical protein
MQFKQNRNSRFREDNKFRVWGFRNRSLFLKPECSLVTEHQPITDKLLNMEYEQNLLVLIHSGNKQIF